ncbi:MAG: hypothetical protein ACOX50_03465 [Patescibacteria group bacterium]|jgi:hypothetical protein
MTLVLVVAARNTKNAAGSKIVAGWGFCCYIESMRLGKISSKLFSLFLGLVVIFFGVLVSYFLSISFANYQVHNIETSRISELYQRSSVLAQIVASVVFLVSLSTKVAAGYLVGFRIKIKGWIYGILLGFIWVSLYTLVLILIPHAFYKFNTKAAVHLSAQVKNKIISESVNNAVSGIPSNLIVTVALTGFGSWIAGKKCCRRQNGC